MASPLTLQSDRGREALLRPRSRAERRPLRTRLDPFPRSRAYRWLLRLLFAVPYAALGWLSSVVLAVPNTPNAQLLARVATIQWDRADAAWLAQIYPPVTTLIAAVLHYRLALSIAGALIAGALLMRVLEIMVQRRFTKVTTVALMLALGANPLFAYTVTENFAAFTGLALFGIGLASLVRFVTWRDTSSGFRAGILFMVAVLSDQSGLLYVGVAAAATPFLSLARRNQPGARASNVLVIVYPAVAVIASLMLLNLAFLGNPIGMIGENLLSGVAARSMIFVTIFTTVNGWLVIAPVISAWLIALIVRRPGAIVVSTLVFAAILVGYVIGLIPANSAGNTFIIMILMAIALVPTARTPLANVLVALVAVLQIGIAWTAAFNRPVVLDWMLSISHAIGFMAN